MARQESDREDLIGEATAFVRRAEWTGNSPERVLFGGFRRDGSVSLYFGADPVYHFDPQGRLRRAYVCGRLYRTQGATLAVLCRRRTAEETQLVRNDLNQSECADFLAEMTRRIEGWRKDWKNRGLVISQQVPENDTEFERDFVAALDRILSHPAGQQLAPRYRGKR